MENSGIVEKEGDKIFVWKPRVAKRGDTVGVGRALPPRKTFGSGRVLGVPGKGKQKEWTPRARRCYQPMADAGYSTQKPLRRLCFADLYASTEKGEMGEI